MTTVSPATPDNDRIGSANVGDGNLLAIDGATLGGKKVLSIKSIFTM